MGRLVTDVGRRWAEWALQGFLVHALRAAPQATRERLLRTLLDDGAPPGGTHVVVDEEVVVGAGDETWRADVRLSWAKQAGRQAVRHIELKLHAPLTERQRKALEQGTLHVIVCPRARKAHLEREVQGVGHAIPVITWEQLAEAIAQSMEPNRGKTIRDLLAGGGAGMLAAAAACAAFREAESMAEGFDWLERIDAQDVSRATRTNDEVQKAKDFLDTFHWIISEKLPGYRPSPQWLHSKKQGYLGYCFDIATGQHRVERSFWVGFELDDGNPVFSCYDSKDNLIRRAPDGHGPGRRFDVVELASEVAKRLSEAGA